MAFLGLTGNRSGDSSEESITKNDYGATQTVEEVGVGVNEHYDDNKRQIGVISAIFLIFNRMIGTGIFATPSSIYLYCGSVGLSLMMWVIGAIISGAGLWVYLEWGSAIPKNGGEKNYLEFFYRRPKFLASSMYAAYVFLLGWAASNSVVFGEYILVAAGKDVTRWNQRLIGFACVTFSFLIHSVALKWGLRLQNFLGLFKLVVIAIIIISGWVALSGRLDIEKTHAFSNAFEGSTNATAYGVVTALYNIIWSFIGYSNANYALSEVKNPNRILKVAAPWALVSVAIMYLLCNISYFAVVPKETISSSGRILAAQFFGIVFGKRGETALSVFVAISALGNVMSVIFSQGRIVQALAREGLLPLSNIWSSNRPFNAPLAGLFEHWVVSVIIMLAPPPGDAYNFILNLISYPLSVVNCFVAAALILIYVQKYRGVAFLDWHPPIRAGPWVAGFFFLSSLYLVIAPFVPPDTPANNIYKSLPYYLHAVVGIALFFVGAIYWLLWAKILPHFGGYDVQRKELVDSYGHHRLQIVRVYKDGREALSYF